MAKFDHILVPSSKVATQKQATPSFLHNITLLLWHLFLYQLHKPIIYNNANVILYTDIKMNNIHINVYGNNMITILKLNSLNINEVSNIYNSILL